MPALPGVRFGPARTPVSEIRLMPLGGSRMIWQTSLLAIWSPIRIDISPRLCDPPVWVAVISTVAATPLVVDVRIEVTAAQV